MTDQQPDQIDDDAPVSVEIELVPEDEIQLRQVAFGLGLPKILLTVEEDEETGGITFKALGAGFDSHAELVDMARQHLDVLALGVEQDAEEGE